MARSDLSGVKIQAPGAGFNLSSVKIQAFGAGFNLSSVKIKRLALRSDLSCVKIVRASLCRGSERLVRGGRPPALSIRSDPLEDRGDALAAADAHGDEGVTPADAA